MRLQVFNYLDWQDRVRFISPCLAIDVWAINHDQILRPRLFGLKAIQPIKRRDAGLVLHNNFVRKAKVALFGFRSAASTVLLSMRATAGIVPPVEA